MLSREGPFCLPTPEPGIGKKTRLVEETQTIAANMGFAAQRSHCRAMRTLLVCLTVLAL